MLSLDVFFYLLIHPAWSLVVDFVASSAMRLSLHEVTADYFQSVFAAEINNVVRMTT